MQWSNIKREAERDWNQVVNLLLSNDGIREKQIFVVLGSWYQVNNILHYFKFRFVRVDK